MLCRECGTATPYAIKCYCLLFFPQNYQTSLTCHHLPCNLIRSATFTHFNYKQVGIVIWKKGLNWVRMDAWALLVVFIFPRCLCQLLFLQIVRHSVVNKDAESFSRRILWYFLDPISSCGSNVEPISLLHIPSIEVFLSFYLVTGMASLTKLNFVQLCGCNEMQRIW